MSSTRCGSWVLLLAACCGALRAGMVTRRWDADGDRNGWMNGFLMWEPQTITDEPGQFAITIWLDGKALEDSCTVDLTPRRCQEFKAKPAQAFKWTHTSLAEKKQPQSGTARADDCGLVTLEKLLVSTNKSRIRMWRP